MADKITPQTQSGNETNDLQESAVFQDTMNHFMAIADIDAVYGAPLQVSDQLIIPTAEIMCAMGFGYGSGTWTPPSDEEQKTSAQAGSTEEAESSGGQGIGGGGGGYTFSRPVALVIASPEGVRVVPVIDRTKIWLAAFTAAGFMMGMAARMLKR